MTAIPAAWQRLVPVTAIQRPGTDNEVILGYGQGDSH
jgi:hypothetical protein